MQADFDADTLISKPVADWILFVSPLKNLLQEQDVYEVQKLLPSPLENWKKCGASGQWWLVHRQLNLWFDD